MREKKRFQILMLIICRKIKQKDVWNEKLRWNKSNNIKQKELFRKESLFGYMQSKRATNGLS